MGSHFGGICPSPPPQEKSRRRPVSGMWRWALKRPRQRPLRHGRTALLAAPRGPASLPDVRRRRAVAAEPLRATERRARLAQPPTMAKSGCHLVLERGPPPRKIEGRDRRFASDATEAMAQCRGAALVPRLAQQ